MIVDLYDFEGVIEPAFEAVLTPTFKVKTSQTDASFTSERPRIELELVVKDYRNQFKQLLLGQQPRAGETPDMSATGEIHVDIITKANSKEHSAFRAKVRFAFSTIITPLKAALNPQGFYIQELAPIDTEPKWTPEDGVYQSKLIFSIQFSKVVKVIGGVNQQTINTEA